MGRRLGRLCAAATSAAMLILAAACGGSDSTTPDHGPYSVRPGDDRFDRTPSRARGVLAESLRLGDHIVFATDVDPDLTTVVGGGVLANAQGLLDAAASPEQRAAAAPHGVAGAFGTFAANAEGQPRKFLAVTITSFRDEQSAAAAAADIDRVDFESNPDNAPVLVDNYPAALTHWIPGMPSISSTMAWKSLVIHVYAELQDPDLGRLVGFVDATLNKQLAALADFTPEPVPDPAVVPLDPDKMLARLVRTGAPLADIRDFAAFGVRAYSALSKTPATEFASYSAKGVTGVAISQHKFLYRLRDAAAAQAYGTYLAGVRDEHEYSPIDGVSDLSGVTCAQAARPSPTSLVAIRFRCIVVHGVDVAVVYSNTDTDVRQLAAAQYEVMAA